AQALVRAGRVRALSQGRAHLAVADVRHYAAEVLQHRVILNYDGQAEGLKLSALVQDILAQVPEEIAA
ncbi:MAG: AAA family ATPase, partial [Planctomycetes bacterium]|nr:AAA family ATPase [Planctomycetota bacterium]